MIAIYHTIEISNGVKIDVLRDAVFQKQGVLAKIYKEYGHLSLADYARQWPVGRVSDKTGQFVAAFADTAAGLYGKSVAVAAAAQLSRQPLVSTIDHLGVFGHPFFLNSNLIYSLRPNQDFLICLPTAGVSLNNSSWPGCLLVSDKNGQMQRFSFFPDKVKTKPVLGLPAVGQPDVDRVLKNIQQTDFLTVDAKLRLSELVSEVFLRSEVLGLKDFTSQSAAVAGVFWQKIFPSAPKLLYVPLEKVVANLLLQEGKEPGVLSELLFTETGWQVLEEYFDGSLGAFSSGHKGSFLFWGIDTQGRRQRLYKSGRAIAAAGGTQINPKGLGRALAEGQVYPTSLVCFLVLLYYQITCLGGFNQVNWLTDVKLKFVLMLRELGHRDLAEQVAKAVTENFAEGDLAFSAGNNNSIFNPTLLDLFLGKNELLMEKYHKLAGVVSVGQSIDCQLPEIYKVITPATERDPELTKILESEIISQMGMAAKILPAR